MMPIRSAGNARGARISASLAWQQSPCLRLDEGGHHALESPDGRTHPTQAASRHGFHRGRRIDRRNSCRCRGSQKHDRQFRVLAGTDSRRGRLDDRLGQSRRHPAQYRGAHAWGSLTAHENKQLFTFRFDTPGKYDSMCGLHPFTHGRWSWRTDFHGTDPVGNKGAIPLRGPNPIGSAQCRPDRPP